MGRDRVRHSISVILFTLNVTSILPNTPSVHLQSTDGKISMTDIGEAFVDDSFLGVTSTYTPNPNLCDRSNRRNAELHTIALLTRLSQQWECLLFATGGALCLNKSFWYLISWTWTKTGTAKPTTAALAPGVLSLTSGYDTNSPIDVPRIETTSTYRTLGVRISPSGETKHTFAYLRVQSNTFATKISSSALTRTDAYWAFWQYFHPRIGFSMPVLALSQTQCTSIQSPALCATLSKLHLNKHTSRAIVFGPSEYGGLEMPELYTPEGIGQLWLLLGHLRLRYETASLILIDISYLQLIVGSSTLFFNLPFTMYGHSTDGGWLSSSWQFLNSIGFQLYIKQAQPPPLPRQNDIALMDYFVSLHLKPKLLRVLNRCRIYLQVIYLSDVCSADGSHILCPYKHGHRLPARTSALDWPYQPRPPATAWKQWISTLQHLESNNKLIKCLGNWVNSSHQQWEHFLSPTTSTLYVKSAGTWTTFRPLQQENLRPTRASSHPKYDLRRPEEPCDLPTDAVPTTIVSIRNSPHIRLLSSPSPLCPLLASTFPQNIQRDADISDPHPYYTQLLDWDRSEIESITPGLITAMTENKLHMCADGFYVKDTKQGSHAWVFADNQRQISWKGAGPSMGHSAVMTPYRAELSGLTSILFLLLWVCNEHGVEGGDVTIYCDNISALNQVFTKACPSNNP